MLHKLGVVLIYLKARDLESFFALTRHDEAAWYSMVKKRNAVSVKNELNFCLNDNCKQLLAIISFFLLFCMGLAYIARAYA